MTHGDRIDIIVELMESTVKHLPKSEVEITVTLSVEELRPHLEAAADRLSRESKIEGFRPGKAPYEIVTARFGEMKIYEAALESAVRKSYTAAVREHNLQTVGSPRIEVKTLAPGNPLTYTAAAPLLPAVEKLADIRAIRVEKKSIQTPPADVDKALGELQKMQTREAEVDRPAERRNKVVVNLQMFLDNVPIEGGQAKAHQIYLSEPYYVKGLADQLVGLKKGDAKEFKLEFPKEHYQKNIAGKTLDFKVEMVSVFELTPPALDDTFAQTLGQKTLTDLREVIQKNLQSEADGKELQRQEIEMLEKITDGSRFGEIPELLINAETDRMVHELEHGVTEQGLEFDQYLKNLHKTRADLKLDFAAQAVRRIKTILATRRISEMEKIEADDAEVAAVVTEHLNASAGDPEAQKRIREPEYEDTIRTALRNRKVIKFLKELIIK